MMTREEIEKLNESEPYCFETDKEEQWYKVVTGNCEECYFGNKSFEFCEGLKEYIGSCNFSERKDRKCVCFKLVEE